MRLLVVEADVVISNQYNQFCVRGVPEHPVETPHVVLPVLQRHKNSTKRRGSRIESRVLIRQTSPQIADEV